MLSGNIQGLLYTLYVCGGILLIIGILYGIGYLIKKCYNT